MQGILNGYCSWTCCYVAPTSEDEAVTVRQIEAVSAREIGAVTPAPEDKAISVRGVAEGEPCVTSKDCPWARTIYYLIVESSQPITHNFLGRNSLLMLLPDRGYTRKAGWVLRLAILRSNLCISRRSYRSCG